MAFFMYLMLSFSMSWCDRMVFFRSSSTIIPGPTVHGPEINIMIRAAVLGYVASKRETAIDNAAPVALDALFPVGTGHGSLDSLSMISDKTDSHWETGCKNFIALFLGAWGVCWPGLDCIPGGCCPGCCWCIWAVCGVTTVTPSHSCNCFTV